jgi:CheY-like chemotaxis protein
VNDNLFTYLFGPRLNWRKFEHFVPFGEILAGGARGGTNLPGGSSQSAFALATGGGVDMVLTQNLAWRVAQLDYLLTSFSGTAVGATARQNSFRAGTGLVYRFGIPKPPPPPNHPPVAACSVSPASVYAGSGDSVTVHVNASDPDNDLLTYSYSATGGSIEGTGPDARWKSTGVAVGTYTANVKVDDGKGGTASCVADIKVEEKPNHPPTATLSVERSPILPGEQTGITCDGSDPDIDPLTYSYTTTGGRVVGSGSKVQFDATGLQPGTYAVKCTVNDGRGGTADASDNVEVKEPPQVKQLEAKLALHSIYFPTAQPTVAEPMGGLLASQAVTLDTLASDFLQYLKYRPDATKPAGVGTGLGLAIVLSVVREHGGQVHVLSPPQGGTIFHIELPIAAEMAQDEAVGSPLPGWKNLPAEDAAAAARENRLASASEAGKGVRVLVVEDEPTVARLIADVLEDEGMHVDVLLDGREALDRAARQTFDLVICDMKMPGLDGQHFYKSLERSANPLRERFLFVTGDVIAAQTREFLERHHLPHVAKPFRVEELTEKVHGVLAISAGHQPQPAQVARKNAARNG